VFGTVSSARDRGHPRAITALGEKSRTGAGDLPVENSPRMRKTVVSSPIWARSERRARALVTWNPTRTTHTVCGGHVVDTRCSAFAVTRYAVTSVTHQGRTPEHLWRPRAHGTRVRSTWFLFIFFSTGTISHTPSRRNTLTDTDFQTSARRQGTAEPATRGTSMRSAGRYRATGSARRYAILSRL
jgi:hypothetical protein